MSFWSEGKVLAVSSLFILILVDIVLKPPPYTVSGYGLGIIMFFIAVSVQEILKPRAT